MSSNLTAARALGFYAKVYVNVTTVAEARRAGDPGVADLTGRDDHPAIFCRLRPGARPGDRLYFAALLRVQAMSARAAAEEAFAAGNGVGAHAADYAAQLAGAPDDALRSVSVGDVVVVETPDGPAAFACEGLGWASVDLADFVIVGGAL